MPHLDLSDDQAAALIKVLRDGINNDCYPLFLRIRTLKAILARSRPLGWAHPYRTHIGCS